MFRLLAFLAFFFCHAVQAESRDAWFGRYATLNADGFDHLAQRWIGHERAGAIDFSFDTSATL